MSKKIRATVRSVYPIGASVTTNTNYDDVGYARVVFDKSAYANIKAIYFQATLQNNGVADTLLSYARLVNDGGTEVTGSEVSADLSQYATSIQTSGDIKAVIASGATVYRVQNKVETGGNGGSITNAIIVEYYV